MGFYGFWGEASFHVYDGGNLVGAGTVALFENAGASRRWGRRRCQGFESVVALLLCWVHVRSHPAVE